ncbi:MAG TPA: ribokinase [Mycobacterium sp.]|nr:ribokinase [Mycobacterium sp.]
MADVYVVGSLNADHRVRVSRIPMAGETILGSEIVVAAGGKGANQAVAASRAGAAAIMIGSCGDDADGDVVRTALARQGVDTRHVHVASGSHTGRALITVDDDGGNTIVVSPGANTLLTQEDVSAGLRPMRAGDFLLLQLETPEPLVRHAARTAADAGGLVVLNAAPVPRGIDGLLDHVNVLVVNEHELAGIASVLGKQAARDVDMATLASASGAIVICTAGSDGAYVMHENHIEHVAAPEVEAVDTTAAGDTFIGYLAARLAQNAADLLGACETAVHAAALAVTREGAIDSIPFSTKGQA